MLESVWMLWVVQWRNSLEEWYWGMIVCTSEMNEFLSEFWSDLWDAYLTLAKHSVSKQGNLFFFSQNAQHFSSRIIIRTKPPNKYAQKRKDWHVVGAWLTLVSSEVVESQSKLKH